MITQDKISNKATQPASGCCWCCWESIGARELAVVVTGAVDAAGTSSTDGGLSLVFTVLSPPPDSSAAATASHHILRHSHSHNSLSQQSPKISNKPPPTSSPCNGHFPREPGLANPSTTPLPGGGSTLPPLVSKTTFGISGAALIKKTRKLDLH